jgi:hypothetical protein
MRQLLGSRRGGMLAAAKPDVVDGDVSDTNLQCGLPNGVNVFSAKMQHVCAC